MKSLSKLAIGGCVGVVLLAHGWAATPRESVFGKPVVAAGNDHSTLLRLNGSLYSFGNNSYSQLGDNTSTHRNTPVYIANQKYLWLDAGANFNIAIKSDSTLWVWGDDNAEQLGNGNVGAYLKPTQLGSAKWIWASAGTQHSLAIQKDSTLWAWGLNNFSQLGDGNTTTLNAPAQIGGDTWIWASAGATHSAAIMSDSTLWTWGHNSKGQLGDGSNLDKVGLAQVGSAQWLAVSAGDSVTAGIQSDNSLWTWGENTNGQLGLGSTVNKNVPTKVGSASWISVSAGASHMAAIKSDSTLWAWGDNTYGQLGDGSTTQRTSPVAIGSAKWLWVSVGLHHTIGMQSDSSVWVWGKNTDGQLGDGTNTQSTSPKKITSYPTIAQTITFTAITDKVYSATGVSLTATSTSGLTVAFSDSTPSICTVSGTTVTMVGIGTCTIKANQAGNSNFSAATQVVRSFAISKKPLTISGLSASHKVYNNNTLATLTGTASLVGKEGSDVVTLDASSASSNFATKNVGTAINITVGGYALAGADASKYSITQPTGFSANITARPITIKANAQTKVYGDNDPSLTWTTTSGTYATGETNAIVTGSLTRVSGETKGKYQINKGSLTAGSNYTLTYDVDSLTVTTRPISISVDRKTKVYGAADPAFTFTTDEDPSVVTGNLYRDTTGHNGVGVYDIKTDSLVVDTNYSAPTITADSLVISKAVLTVQANDTSIVYGESDPTFTWHGTGYQLSDDSTVVTGSLSRVSGIHVGKYPLTVGTLASPNYTITFNTDTLSVIPDTLTVTAAAKTKKYGALDPTFTFTATGFNYSDTKGLITGALSRDTGRVIGKYQIKKGTLSAGSNYVITYVPDSLTITPRALTVTAAAKTKVFGAANPSFTWTGVGYANGDGASKVTGSLYVGASDTTVGKYQIKGDSLVADSNYTLTYVADSLTVTARPLTIKANSITKTYGDTDTLAWSITSGTYAPGDDSTVISGVISRADTSENVGKYVIGQNTLAANSNYNLTFVGDTLTISPKAITITAAAKSKVYKAADPIFTWSITSGSYAFSEDSTTISGALVRDTGKAVGKYEIKQGTLGNANYAITFVPDSLTITQKALTITAAAKTKVYGSVDPTLTWVGSGFAAGDNATSIIGSLARDAGDTVGKYLVNIGTLANANYNITYVPETLTVTKKVLTITAAPKTKVYGEAEPAYSWHGVGYITGEDSTLVTGNLYRTLTDTIVGKFELKGDSLSAGGNYSITYVPDSVTITTRPLTITAAAQTKVYGDADPTMTWSAIGYAPNEDSTTLTGSLSRSAGNNVGNYVIKKGSLSAGSNYNVTYVADTLKITPLAISIKPDVQAKTYGDADPTFTWGVTSGAFAYSDDQTVFSGELARDTGSVVGTYEINQGDLSNANYTITFAPDTLTINQRAITIKATAASKVYGAVDPTFVWTKTSGTYAPGEGAIDITGVLSRDTGRIVGKYQITQGTVDNSNYNITYVADSLTIATRPITVKADQKTKAYGSVDPTFTWAITSGTLASGDSISNTFTGSLSRDTGSVVGNYVINAGTLSPGSNYALTYDQDTLKIIKANQNISFGVISSKTYGDSLVVAPSASSSLTVVIASVDSTICTINGFKIKTKSKGTCVIKATQAGNEGYFAADTVSQSFKVNRKLVVIAPEPKTRNYGQADSVAKLTYKAVGVVYSDSLRSALSRVAGDTAGIYKILPHTFNDTTVDTNYTFVVDTTVKFTIKAVPLLVKADSLSKIFGSADPTLTWSATGYVNGDSAGNTITGALTRTVSIATNNVGRYPISIGTLKSNNNYVMTFVGDSLRVKAKPCTVTVAAKTKVYGVADPTFTYSSVGLATASATLGNVALTGALSRDTGKAVGKYAILQGTLANTNYAITFVKDSLTITPKALTVTATAKTKIYGNPDPALTYTTSGLLSGDALTGALTRASGDTVAKYAISQGTLANSNYTISYTGDSLSITQKPISIKVDSVAKVYGNTDPRLTFTTIGGLVGSDTIAGALSRVNGDTVGTYLISRGTLTDAANKNYKITFTSASLRVTPKTVTVKVDSAYKAFGTPDSLVSFVYQVTGLIGSDVLTGKLSRVSGEAVGRYAITKGTLANKNYNIDYVGDSLRIGKKEVLVIVDAKSKVYASTDPTFTYKTVGLSKGATLSGSLSRAFGEKVGAYAINKGTLDSLNPNYTISYVYDSLRVTPKSVTVSAVAKTKVYGTAFDSVTYTAVGLSGSDKLFGKLSWDTTTIVGKYLISKGTLTNSNYSIIYVPNYLTISPKAITVKADTGKTKVYGATDPVFTYVATGLVGSDTLTGALSRATGSIVGTYNTSIGTLANSNYTITFTPSKFTITPRPITVKADAKTKVYGASDPALTWTKTSGTYATGDDASKITGNLGRAAGNLVGKYAINKGSLSNANYAITFTADSLTVTRKPITVVATAKAKAFGASDPTFNFTATGLVGTDALVGTLVRDTGRVVGKYAINQGTVTDSANKNYSITYTRDSLTIQPKTVTVTVAGKTKTYGASDPAFTYTSVGLVGSDTFTGSLVRVAGENVGSYAINKGTLANSNYAINLVPGKLIVNPKAITIKADSISKAKNTADPIFTWKATTSYVQDSTLGIFDDSSTFVGKLTRTSGELEGKYSILKGSLANPNYSVTYVGNYLTITADTTHYARGVIAGVYSDAEKLNHVEGYTEVLSVSGQILWSGNVVNVIHRWTLPATLQPGLYLVRNQKVGSITVFKE